MEKPCLVPVNLVAFQFGGYQLKLTITRLISERLHEDPPNRMFKFLVITTYKSILPMPLIGFFAPHLLTSYNFYNILLGLFF